jgi:nucleoside-diphosphate-sugar epimerase
MSVLGYPFFERPIAPGYVPIDSAHPVEAQDAYGLSKWLGEEIIDAATRRSGMSAVSLRLPWIQTREGFLANVETRRARAIATPCDLWGYVDTRDAAEAFKLSLEAKIVGHARLFISAADTFMNEETGTLLATAYPETTRRSAMPGHRSIFELDEAKAVLGFEARHSWRDY